MAYYYNLFVLFMVMGYYEDNETNNEIWARFSKYYLFNNAL